MPQFVIFNLMYSLEWHFLVVFLRLLWTDNLGILRHWEELIKRLQQFLLIQIFSKMEGWKEVSSIIHFKCLRKQCYGISWCCYFLYIWSHSRSHHHWQFFGRTYLVLEASELFLFKIRLFLWKLRQELISQLWTSIFITYKTHKRWGR